MTKLVFSHFADNPNLHREIRSLLASFDEPSRSRMRAKIRHDRAAARDQGTEQADANARHTHHEFVLGRQLQRRGWRPEYNRKIDGKTPDWYDERARLILDVFTCERGGTTAPAGRVVARIAGKIRKYAQTARDHGLCFVVAVYGDRLSGLTAGDCERAIHEGRLFADHPDLSGVIFFTADDTNIDGNAYAYTYFSNPTADRKIVLAV